MAFIIDDDGNITMVQGDTGEIVIEGLLTDKNYSVYLAIQDKNRKAIGSELNVNSNQSSTVTFVITGALSDLLTVPKNQDTETYYYGVKACATDFEDTLLLGGNDIGDQNTITVYPRKVAGA